MTGQWHFWCGARGDRIGWFRILGIGLAWKDHRVHGPLFTERYRGQYGIPKRKRLHLGNWCIQVTTWRHP